MSKGRKRPKIHQAMRQRVYERDGYRCVYCGCTEEEMTLCVDHVIPLSQGGLTTDENLTTACAPCNNDKGVRTPKEWRGSEG